MGICIKISNLGCNLESTCYGVVNSLLWMLNDVNGKRKTTIIMYNWIIWWILVKFHILLGKEVKGIEMSYACNWWWKYVKGPLFIL